MTDDTTTPDATHHPQATADVPLAGVCPASTLRTALDAVAVLVDECVVGVDDGGFSVTAVDPANVAMVSLSLPADAFDAFDARGTALGVSLDRLLDVVGMAGRDRAVRLRYDTEARKLQVRVGELSYTLALIDPDAIRSPPDADAFADQFEAAVTVEGRAFSRAVAAADLVSDHLELGVDETGDYLYARAQGDTDSTALELAAEDCVAFDPGSAHSLFSLDYLTSVDRAVPADGPVRLRIGEDAPVEIEFDVAGGDGSVRYVLSPRLNRQ